MGANGWIVPPRSEFKRWNFYAPREWDPTMLNKDFHDFLSLLAKHNVRHLVVGGYAVALHGYPHLLRNMSVTGRGKDKVDVEELRRRHQV